MKLYPRVFSLPKEGNSSGEYEDAACANEHAGRIAVSDGAGDSYDSGRWARMLVKSFALDQRPPLPEAIEEWLEPLAQTWAAEIAWEQLPWYKFDKAQQGAFATFIGIEFDEKRWFSFAVGDACLFQIRDDELLPPTPFPVRDCAAFGNTPPLISTDPHYNHRSLTELKNAAGEYRLGDIFLLATDALAQSLICAHREGKKPWTRFKEMSEAEFEAWVTELRHERALRNDDVTLVVVAVEASDAPERIAEPMQRVAPLPQIISASGNGKSGQAVNVRPVSRRKPSTEFGFGSTRLAIILVLTALDVIVVSVLIVLILRSRL